MLKHLTTVLAALALSAAAVPASADPTSTSVSKVGYEGDGLVKIQMSMRNPTPLSRSPGWGGPATYWTKTTVSSAARRSPSTLCLGVELRLICFTSLPMECFKMATANS